MRVKKIRMTLNLNGVEVRTLDELRENFDAEKIWEYFKDGTLLKFLDAWHYTIEAVKIRELDAKINIQELCKILGVEYFTPEEIAWRTERLDRLKKFTSDEKILAQVDNVAFDNDDLLDILEEGEIKEIYLCGAKFTFSSGMLNFENRHYHGVGNVTVKLETDEDIDFDVLGLKFENIQLEGNFPRQVNSTNTPPSELEILTNKANNGNVDSMWFLGLMYKNGEGVEQDFQKAIEWYEKAAKLGDAHAMNNLGDMYRDGEGVKKDLSKARKWYKKAAELGNILAKENLKKLK